MSSWTGRILVAVVIFAGAAVAQTGALHGVVTDESGAVVPGAQITARGSSGLLKSTTSARDGAWSLTGMGFGAYEIEASAPQLALPGPVKVELHSASQTVTLQLKIAATAQHVDVQDSAGAGVNTDASSNAGAIVLRENDLQALADDPEDLVADLQALAGPSAGPGGGEIFVDGFSGGQLPSKESIREIRVNQNPFAPEYDKLGLGRIEIFTKPGTDKLKGTGFYNFADSVWNSRDPYAAGKAPFLLKEYGGNLSGPLNSRASWFFDVQRHAIDNGAVIDAITLDPRTLGIVNPFTEVYRVPQRRIIVSPRLDYQLNAKNTLTLRYQLTSVDIRDSGIGSLNLVSLGQHAYGFNQTVQGAETMVIGTKAINEIRFQYFRAYSSTSSNSPDPEIQVLGAFNGGGAQTGNASTLQNSYEFQDYATITAGRHTWRVGTRLRAAVENDATPKNFGGTFTFAGGLAPVLDALNQPILDSAGNPEDATITSIERYRRTLVFQQLGYSPRQILALGGGPTQFTLNAGTPYVSAGQFDIGLFTGGDWRIRPNLTLNVGLRYEWQTNIHDRRDFAPRIGLAWAPGAKRGGASKTVIRAGFGMFYERFPIVDVLMASLYNGLRQQQYVVNNPLFYLSIPPPSALSGSLSTQVVQEIDSNFRAPYIMQSALGVERQLPWHLTVAVTYANSHGLHQFRSNDINAPLPGTFNPLVPGSGVYPYTGRGPILMMESSGLYNQNQIITNVNARVSSRFSLFGFYVYNRAFSNTDGLSTFPANPYDFSGEYGPAATDIRNRGSFGGSISVIGGFTLSPLLNASSGLPFDVTTGNDPYGDSIFAVRPGIATDPTRPGLIETKYGLLDPNPIRGEKILPRNYGRGPGSAMLNVRISRVFAFGPRGEGSVSTGGGNRGSGGVFTGGQTQTTVSTRQRYNLAISLQVRNILNHTNPGAIIGNITSPLFGLANQSAGATSLGGTNFLESANNRRLELQARFTF